MSGSVPVVLGVVVVVLVALFLVTSRRPAPSSGPAGYASYCTSRGYSKRLPSTSPARGCRQGLPAVVKPPRDHSEELAGALEQTLWGTTLSRPPRVDE